MSALLGGAAGASWAAGLMGVMYLVGSPLDDSAGKRFRIQLAVGAVVTAGFFIGLEVTP